MPPVMAAFLLSFGVIFVAELGDKSQLMALAFAARYKALPILVGIAIATALVHAFSVAVGAVLGVALPARAIKLVAGVAFFALRRGRCAATSSATTRRPGPTGHRGRRSLRPARRSSW